MERTRIINFLFVFDKNTVTWCFLIGSQERNQIIAKIRNQGSFEYNTREDFNKGDLIVPRRSKYSKKFNNFKVCPNCKVHYSKYAIRKHYPKCIPDYEKGDRSAVGLCEV